MSQTQKPELEIQDKVILTYLEELIRKKGVKKMPEDILSDMVVDLWLRFDRFIFLSVMQTLSSGDHEKFDEFLEKEPNQEEMMDFLKNNVDNLEEVIKQAMEDFEKIYLGEKSVVDDEK